MHRFGVAVVGCGGMGKAHVAAAAQSERTELIAAVDLFEQTAKEAARLHGARKALTDYRQALDDDAVEVVVVATPPSTHREITEAALRAGKHVLCEKPLAANLPDALAMCRTAIQTRRKLRVGYIIRHNASYQTMADMIRSDAIGRPLIMRLHSGEDVATEDAWRRDLSLIKETSPLIDCGCHYVDVMRWFSGEEAVAVSGIGARTEADVPPDNLNYEMLAVTLSGGSCGVYEVGWSHAYRRFTEKEFIGPKGRIRLTYAQDRPSNRDKGDLIEYFAIQPREYKTVNVPGAVKPVVTELNDLIDYIEEARDPTPGLNDALQSLAIVLCGHEAIRQGRTIPVPRVTVKEG
jgi:predicted dehydrogenase